MDEVLNESRSEEKVNKTSAVNTVHTEGDWRSLYPHSQNHKTGSLQNRVSILFRVCSLSRGFLLRSESFLFVPFTIYWWFCVWGKHSNSQMTQSLKSKLTNHEKWIQESIEFSEKMVVRDCSPFLCFNSFPLFTLSAPFMSLRSIMDRKPRQGWAKRNINWTEILKHQMS